MEFTDEQIAIVEQQIAEAKAQWESDILNPVLSERDDLLQYKPIEKSVAEKAIEQRERELFKKELSIELKANGLEDFAEFIQVSNMDELKTKMEALNTVLEARKVNTAFVPGDRKQTNPYEQAAKNNDVVGMIGAKINKLFN
ncbi:hypothetical protein [Paenibacillus vini]|uniref:DUF4355 domain-containing protein n=1 Tax=Paenibacillus vini TaxID=1476024 RepID=A0ABQ4M769_9BACL|nr:hypothetical protein [Paenibacillus vini]GIP51817.1 hypothetical protein J42TS3_08520 [Paenibacillus vini]